MEANNKRLLDFERFNVFFNDIISRELMDSNSNPESICKNNAISMDLLTEFWEYRESLEGVFNMLDNEIQDMMNEAAGDTINPMDVITARLDVVCDYYNVPLENVNGVLFYYPW